jgi:phosphoserine phosphatase RsbU/P
LIRRKRPLNIQSLPGRLHFSKLILFNVYGLEKNTTSGASLMLRGTIYNIPLFRKTISKIPMRISLPLLFTAPVIGVVIILSAISFLEGKSTANDLMEQNLAQIQEHIQTRLDDLLNLPGRIQQLNTNLIQEGWLDLQNLRSWRRTLFEQVQAFNGLSSITWGGADGRSVGIARDPGDIGYEFTIKDKETGDKRHEFFCDANGQMKKEPDAVVAYDPRNRPWYKAAIDADKSTWTAPYTRADAINSGDELALGYAKPIRDRQGKIIGVMNAELTLDDIALFLEKLSVGRTGKAFLIDKSGHLIATSSGVPIKDAGNSPVVASAAADRQIAAAATRLEEEFGSYEAIEGRYQLTLDIHGKPYLLMVSPSKHETGLTWIIATLVPESDFLAEHIAGRYRNFKIGGLAVFFTLLFGVVVAAISIWPMMDLVAFVNRVHQGDLEQELKLEYSTEFVQLSQHINAMAAGLRDRMRLRNSLVLAQEVQQNLLPSNNPEFIDLDITGHATYCDETGGDYFDFLKIANQPDTTAAIAVGDVVGHGVAAAMLMATARGILRSRCRTPGTLADLLTHLNSLLVEDTRGDRFMTMLLLTVDAKRKEMCWATAGHDTPIVYDPATDQFIEFKGNGVSLGLVEDAVYEEHIFTDIKTGQVIMALTDGLWEAFNEDGEMFGKDRVRNLIRQFANLSAVEISERITAELSNFLEQKSPSDDLTFVIVKIL